jgi:hypothetical protein
MSKMPNIGSNSSGTSNPSPSPGRIASRGGASLANSDNSNVANFPEDPEVFNASPATKKSYSWNKGSTGNAT